MNTRRVVYHEPQNVFFADVEKDKVRTKMKKQCQVFGLKNSPSEQLSWHNNAIKVMDILKESGVNDTYVTFEFMLPYSFNRVDCMIYGTNAEGKPNVVHIELKQWSNNTVNETNVGGTFSVSDGEGDDEMNYVEAYTGGANRIEAHPSQQARGYDGYMRNFIEAFSNDDVGLKGMAWCYNYLHHPDFECQTALYDIKFNQLLSEIPTYGMDDKEVLADTLKKELSNGHGFDCFNKIMSSRIKPSKKLLDEAANIINNGQTDAFSLINEQIVAKNAIIDNIRMLRKAKGKSVVLVKGGPGTGKTVIALNLIAELAKKQYNIHYTTKSSPLLDAIQHKVRNAKLLFSSVFAFNPSKVAQNEIDILLVDEAHRLTQKAYTRFDRANARTEMPLIDVLIRAAKVTVFFIDDEQAVRKDEIGRSTAILEAARNVNANVEEVQLKSQFRCNGSDNYLDWIEQMLYNQPLISSFNDQEYDFRIYEDVGEMYAELCRMDKPDQNQTARLIAGFCWEWSSKLNSDGDLVKDVRIGDFAIPWESNEKITKLPDGYVPWKQWAYRPEGLKQCGCIYTAQGFEFDYVGIIVGPDMRFDESLGKIITDKNANKDPQLTRSSTPQDFDEYCRNIYRVLMSRGMKGCFVYFCDEALRNHFKQQLHKMRKPADFLVKG